MDDDFSKGASGRCELCGREVHELTRHHLIPRTRHKTRRNKKTFTREEVKERIVWLCVPCHKNVHNSLDNKTLEASYNTLEQLAAYPEIHKFTKWISTRPDGTTVPFNKRK